MISSLEEHYITHSFIKWVSSVCFSLVDFNQHLSHCFDALLGAEAVKSFLFLLALMDFTLLAV